MKGRVTLCEDDPIKAEALAWKTLDKMFELGALFEGSITVDAKTRCVSEIVDKKLIRVRLVITAVLPESEGLVSETICDVRDGISVEASSEVVGPSGGGSSDQT